MGMLCAVSFNRYGRLYYLDPGPHRISVGDKVLVPTDDGPEVAECVWAPQWVADPTDGFPTLLGPAGDEDLRRDEVMRKRKADAKVAAKRLIREHGLPMKVVAVDHVLESPGSSGGRTTIYFTAPHRVDFRSLVRDLGATLHCRVELRQLSARDSARVQGGIGSCGRDLCCATFLNDFEPGTIRRSWSLAMRMVTGSKSLRNVAQHRSRPHEPIPPCTRAESRADSCRSSTRQCRVAPRSRTSDRKSTRCGAVK